MRILTAIFFLALFVLPSVTAHASSTPPDCGLTKGEIRMQVYIPFISATNNAGAKPCHYLKSFTETGEGGREGGTLPDYIKGAFTFSLSIAGLVAMVMIMVGGLQWTMAGGDSGRVKAAQTRISNAVIGLLLLLFSYTILATINPALVDFGGINNSIPEKTLYRIEKNAFDELVAKNKALSNAGKTDDEVTAQCIVALHKYMDVLKWISDNDDYSLEAKQGAVATMDLYKDQESKYCGGTGSCQWTADFPAGNAYTQVGHGQCRRDLGDPPPGKNLCFCIVN